MCEKPGKYLRFFSLAAMLILLGSFRAPGQSMYLKLSDYCRKLPSHFDEIPTSRKDTLKSIGQYILAKFEISQPAQILFADQNNAKLSQLAELWFYIAKHYYHIKNLSVYSGGLEPTSFDHRIVPSIQQAGMIIIPPQLYMDNLIYYINIGQRYPDYSMFAKPLDYHLNPHNHFLLVSLCDGTDTLDPAGYGADGKVLLSWDDPSGWDDTPVEFTKYQDCADEIARDMFFLMDYIKREQKALKKNKKKKKKSATRLPDTGNLP